MGMWDLEAIERAFAAAAVDPSRWNEAMETVATVTGARGAGLFPIRGRLPLMPHSESMAEAFEPYVQDGWVHRDERYRALPAALRKGAASEFDFTTMDEIKRSPYYQEFLAPFGWRWFGAVLIGAEDNLWSLSIQRTIEQGPFVADEMDELARLSAKLSPVAAVARALGFAAISGATDAFEFSGHAVVQLDSNGGALRLNIEAEKLIGRGVQISKGRLVADTRDATDMLDRTLRDLLWRPSNASIMPPVSLPRTGRPPLLAYPLALKAIADNPFAQCRALLVLIDPERQRRPSESVLRGAFNLTPAEAKVAARIGIGEPVASLADSLGVTKATARNQLKAVFAKTGVHRQAELVALLAALIGPSF